MLHHNAIRRAYPNVVNIDDKSYIFRLKSLDKPDMSKFDQEARKALKEEMQMMESYGFFSAMTTAVKENYQSSGKIWENPQYKDMDSQRKQQ